MFKSFAIDHIIGESDWSVRVRKRILQIAAYDYNVLIAGPSGTGKELIARALHAHSSRSDKPFIPVDCAAIPGSLFASQLFGHVKGAFTGAQNSTLGCFRAADGGTVFLDEIGELDLDLQAKLLRVLQERQVVPVGSHNPVPVNVRVLAATHRELKKEVREGRFRLDLFYRLNVVRMEAEALKNRLQDIPVLAEHFLAKVAMENGVRLKRISRAAMVKLVEHDWPGNVRELQHAIERAGVFHEGNVLEVEAFEDLGQDEPTAVEIESVYDETLSEARWAPESEQPIMATPFAPPADSPAPTLLESEAETAIQSEYNQWPTLCDIEQTHIKKTLKETFYNQSAAARLLGIDRKQLARRIKKYGIEIPRLAPGRPARR